MTEHILTVYADYMQELTIICSAEGCNYFNDILSSQPVITELFELQNEHLKEVYKDVPNPFDKHRLEVTADNMEDITLQCTAIEPWCNYHVDLDNPVSVTKIKELEEAHIKEINNA